MNPKDDPDYKSVVLDSAQMKKVADLLPGDRLGDKVLGAMGLSIWLCHFAKFDKQNFMEFAGDMFDQFHEQQQIIDRRKGHRQENPFEGSEIPDSSFPTEDDFKTESFKHE